MIAFEILINNEKILTAGMENWDSIHAVLMALRDEAEENNEYNFKVGALLKQTEPEKVEHARWPTKQLSIGDEITIRLIKTDTTDNPIKIYRSDATVQEEPFTEEELFELQKQDYLRLKEKFKNENFA